MPDAISSDPNVLLAESGCMKCIPAGAQNEVIIYLLNEILGTGLTTQQLMDEAKCMKCIPIGMQSEVMISLLCQLAGGGSGPSVPCDNVEGAGDPT